MRYLDSYTVHPVSRMIRVNYYQSTPDPTTFIFNMDNRPEQEVIDYAGTVAWEDADVMEVFGCGAIWNPK